MGSHDTGERTQQPLSLQQRMERHLEETKVSGNLSKGFMEQSLGDITQLFGAELAREEMYRLSMGRRCLGRYPTREDEMHRLRVLDYLGKNPDWESNSQVAKELKLDPNYTSHLFSWLFSMGYSVGTPG